MKPTVIVDTNVLIAANREAVPQTSRQCEDECIRVLENLHAQSICLVDNRWDILGEYIDQLDWISPNGVGAWFIRELLNSKNSIERCRQIPITPHPERGYEEFPDDPDLQDFDRSDRKFVAVAIASNEIPLPPIFNAADSDWKNDKTALQRHGIRVQQIC